MVICMVTKDASLYNQAKLVTINVVPTHIEQLSGIFTVASLLQKLNDLLNLDATRYDLDRAMYHPTNEQRRQLIDRQVEHLFASWHLNVVLIFFSVLPCPLLGRLDIFIWNAESLKVLLHSHFP